VSVGGQLLEFAVYGRPRLTVHPGAGNRASDQPKMAGYGQGPAPASVPKRPVRPSSSPDGTDGDI